MPVENDLLTKPRVMKDYSVYPGEYRPRKFDRKQVCEPNLPVVSNKPAVNIIEQQDCYKIEVMAPGHSKDDFIVTAHKDRVSVFAVREKSPEESRGGYRLQEFDYNVLECDAPLPKNADSDFMSAEYRDGILNLCFFKSKTPAVHSFHPIVVY